MRDKSIFNNFRPSVANNPQKTVLEKEVMRATMNVFKQSNQDNPFSINSLNAEWDSETDATMEVIDENSE